MTETLTVEQLLAGYGEDVQALALRARALILDVFPAAVEMVDGPAHLIGYGTDRTYRGLVCGLALQRGYVNLMFARGAELPDPAGLLAGTGKRARHVKLRRVEDIANPVVRDLLVAALALHRREPRQFR
jgi:hypothetical protein